MSAFIEMTGRQFGRLTVLREFSRTPKVSWLCRCVCSRETVVSGFKLRNGHTKSCGCLRHTPEFIPFSKHGQSATKEYRAWIAIRNRCTNPSFDTYSFYGGRGIRMHQEWHDSVEAFIRDVGPAPSNEHSIDRINGDGHYEPGNVRWATKEQQANNTRTNHVLTHNGLSLTIAQWARRLDMKAGTIASRIFHGWSETEALTTPLLRPHGRQKLNITLPAQSSKLGRNV